jgi:hypothetical protein
VIVHVLLLQQQYVHVHVVAGRPEGAGAVRRLVPRPHQPAQPQSLS